MEKTKIYKYLGRNGSITTSIFLENIAPIPMFQLKASEGKILTNGVRTAFLVSVFEDELEDWKEIDNIGQE